jgi:hypothetical protein
MDLVRGRIPAGHVIGSGERERAQTGWGREAQLNTRVGSTNVQILGIHIAIKSIAHLLEHRGSTETVQVDCGD